MSQKRFVPHVAVLNKGRLQTQCTTQGAATQTVPGAHGRIIPAGGSHPRSRTAPRIRHPPLADPEAVLRSHLPRHGAVKLH